MSPQRPNDGTRTWAAPDREPDSARPPPGPTPTPAEARPKIDGYEVLDEVGRGGMGVVYRARQRAAGGRVVALKVMLGEEYASAQELRRFEREIEIAADLHHPHIAQIYDSGLTHGRHFFAMEFIAGVPLIQYCAERNLVLKERLRLFAAVCDAVAYAHRHGVIHRDLKPTNILVDAEGQPHVLDFGLAKIREAGGEDNETRLTATLQGAVMGTLPYMAPEQAEGNIAAIDTRTDVYALGVILYELMTGHYPYQVVGQMAEVLRHIVEAEPRRPSTVNREVGDEVETIILRALSKAPDRRYASALDLARDAQHFLAGEPIEAKRDSALYVLRKAAQRHWPLLAVAALLLLLLSTASVTGFTLYRRASKARAEALLAGEAEAGQRRTAEAALRQLQQEERKRYRQQAALALRRLNEGRSGAAREALRDVPAGRRHWEWGYLLARTDQSLWTFLAPAGPTPVGPRPLPVFGGGRMAVFAATNAIEVWELETQRRVCTVPAALGPHSGLALSADGQRLAIVDPDGSAFGVVELASGRPAFRADDPLGFVGAVALPPGGALTEGNGEIELMPDGRVRYAGTSGKGWVREWSLSRRRLQGVAAGPDVLPGRRPAGCGRR